MLPEFHIKPFFIAVALGITLLFQGTQKATTTPYVIRKTNQQQVASSTSFVNDVDLFHPIKANTNYFFRLDIPFETGGAISGYKFQITAPTSPVAFVSSVSVYNGVTGSLITSSVSTSASVPFAGALASTGNHYFQGFGTIENGSNDGNIQLQFAQNTSDSNPLTVKRGATLTVMEIK